MAAGINRPEVLNTTSQQLENDVCVASLSAGLSVRL
jgi:hypothetical protein